jgi:hypothetical protein
VVVIRPSEVERCLKVLHSHDDQLSNTDHGFVI